MNLDILYVLDWNPKNTTQRLYRNYDHWFSYKNRPDFQLLRKDRFLFFYA